MSSIHASTSYHSESFSLALYKILTQIHPDIGISNRAISIVNQLMNDIFERIATEAARLAALRKKSTLTSGDIKVAVQLSLGQELAKHAMSEGLKAVTHVNAW